MADWTTPLFDEIAAGLDSSYDPSGPLPEDLQSHRAEFDELDDDLRVKHVYACTGLALYCAQCFEANLQNALVSLHIASGEVRTLQGHDLLVDRLSRQTLGALLADIRKLMQLNDNGAHLIAAALEQRNSLAHGFFYRYAAEFSFADGQRKIIDDLLQRVRLFRAADLLMTAIDRALFRLLGISEKQVAAAYAKLLEECGNGETGRAGAP